MFAVVKAILSYGSTGKRFLAGAIMFLGTFALPSQAQQTCGPSLSQCDPQQDMACLQKYYACGQFDTIVQTLPLETAELTPDQKYFVGASFYGLYIRERAKGLECEMVASGRQYLDSYLTAVDALFDKLGSFGTVGQMDRIYHGTRMLNALNAVSGCVDSAFTRARIQTIAHSEALQFSKSIFLNPPDAAKPEFISLRNALSSFVSRASDLETGIALRRIEIQSARNHLTAIEAIFKEIFGAVSTANGTVTIDSSELDGLAAGSAAQLRAVETEEEEFRTALGGVSAEQYSMKRSQKVAEAEQYLKTSAFHINMIGKVLPTDKTLPFWQLDEVLKTEDDGKVADSLLSAIRGSWLENRTRKGDCNVPLVAAQRWYCR